MNMTCTTPRESVLIKDIAERARSMGICATPKGNADGLENPPNGHPLNLALLLTMDLTACHLNGNALDLGRLLKSDDTTFSHDITGIQAHLDRKTGKLVDHFCPRCSAEGAS